MFARQSSHLSVNKTERDLFVPFLSFSDFSQFQTLRTSQGWGTRFCVQMISLDETRRNNYENWLETFFSFHVSTEFLMNYTFKELISVFTVGIFYRVLSGAQKSHFAE